jgi:hypothetical protein
MIDEQGSTASANVGDHLSSQLHRPHRFLRDAGELVVRCEVTVGVVILADVLAILFGFVRITFEARRFGETVCAAHPAAAHFGIPPFAENAVAHVPAMHGLPVARSADGTRWKIDYTRCGAHCIEDSFGFSRQ